MPKVILDWKTTHDFIKDAFVGYGVPADEAEIVLTFFLNLTDAVLNHTAATASSPFTSTESRQASSLHRQTLKFSRKPKQLQLLTVTTVWVRLSATGL